jgi:hypothetical protein
MMDDPQGKAGGTDDDVQFIMSTCSCSRRKAASALKVSVLRCLPYIDFALTANWYFS